jgi:DNA-binding transcriptional ArsR family regulator
MPTPLPEIYRAFSDPTRLRILNLLLQQPLCVCHVQDVLDLPQVNTSQHLAYLRKAGIVEFERVQTMEGVSLETIGRPMPTTQSEVFGGLRKIGSGVRC